MKTIISTFGENPEGIIQGIKQFGCEKLILLLPRKLNKNSKDGLNKIEILTKEIGIRLEKVEISPYSLMENIDKIKQLVSNNGEEVILNITGGRKTLSLAAALAGFVSNPERIIYIQEEDNKPMQIPQFTIHEKLISKEKRLILKCIKNDTIAEDIIKSLKKENMPKKYYTIMKHLRELEQMGLIEISKSRPHTYRILPNGELLR